MAEQVPLFTAKSTAMDVLTWQILSGNVFGAQAINLNLGNGDTLEILVRTPTDLSVAIRISGYAGGDALGEIFDGPTLTADGTAMLISNRNQQKAADKGPPQTQLFQDPTYSSVGTSIAGQIYIPGGTGGNAVGGVSAETFVVLKPDTEYIIQITNESGTADPFQLSVLFVEGKMSEVADDSVAIGAML